MILISLGKNIALTCTTDNYKCNCILFWQNIVLTCTTDNYKCNLISFINYALSKVVLKLIMYQLLICANKTCNANVK